MVMQMISENINLIFIILLNSVPITNDFLNMSVREEVTVFIDLCFYIFSEGL